VLDCYYILYRSVTIGDARCGWWQLNGGLTAPVGWLSIACQQPPNPYSSDEPPCTPVIASAIL